MGWEDAAKKERPKMQDGFHDLSVVKCIRQKKDGTELATTNGGPYLMVIFEDDNKCQVAKNYFLSDKAQWVAAVDFSKLGLSLKDLDENGITIMSFSNQQFAEETLVGRSSYAKVSTSGKYPDVTLFKEDEVPPMELKRLKEQAPGGNSGLAPDGGIPDDDGIDDPF